MIFPKDQITSERNLADTGTTMTSIPVTMGSTPTQLEGDAARAASVPVPVIGSTPIPTGTDPNVPPRSAAVPPGISPHQELLSALNGFSAAQTWWYETGIQMTGTDYERGLRNYSAAQSKLIRAQRRMLQYIGAI